ncbi:LPD5 domain-containing protein, partial [Yoonia sp.]|uniref:LPD5 domain-containing protein n=1 Tax=Yoonia sp. TaxID=2212373 RepID=UPI002E08B811|nr:LPD5 domain-containing protein [Yoonia sp.]
MNDMPVFGPAKVNTQTALEDIAIETGVPIEVLFASGEKAGAQNPDDFLNAARQSAQALSPRFQAGEDPMAIIGELFGPEAQSSFGDYATDVRAQLYGTPTVQEANVAEMEEGGFLGTVKRRGQQFIRGATEPFAALPEAKAIAQAQLDNQDTAAEDIEGFERGQRLRDSVSDTFGAPNPEDRSFWAMVAEGAGNLVGMAGASLAAGVAGTFAGGPIGGAVAGFGTGGALGSAMTSSQLYREALDAGATEEIATKAANWGFAIGATEIVPIARALKYLPDGVRNRVGNGVMKRFADIAQSAGEEAAQEYLATVASNMVAQQLYDPDRGWTEGATEGALVGAVLGGGAGAIGTGVDMYRNRERPQPIPDTGDGEGAVPPGAGPDAGMVPPAMMGDRSPPEQEEPTPMSDVLAGSDPSTPSPMSDATARGPQPQFAGYQDQQPVSVRLVDPETGEIGEPIAATFIGEDPAAGYASFRAEDGTALDVEIEQINSGMVLVSPAATVPPNVPTQEPAAPAFNAPIPEGVDPDVFMERVAIREADGMSPDDAYRLTLDEALNSMREDVSTLADSNAERERMAREEQSRIDEAVFTDDSGQPVVFPTEQMALGRLGAGYSVEPFGEGFIGGRQQDAAAETAAAPIEAQQLLAGMTGSFAEKAREANANRLLANDPLLQNINSGKVLRTIRDDPLYNLVENPDGSATIVGVKVNETSPWVGQQPTDPDAVVEEGGAPVRPTEPSSPTLKPIPFDQYARKPDSNELIPGTNVRGEASIIDLGGRKIVLREINGVQVPFYLSSGAAGKKNVPAGKWYPILGISADGWINKGSEQQIVDYYGSPELRAAAQELDTSIGDIRNDTSIPKVKPSGAHIDAINAGLTPTENQMPDTVTNLEQNLAGLLSRIEAGRDTAQPTPTPSPREPSPSAATKREAATSVVPSDGMTLVHGGRSGMNLDDIEIIRDPSKQKQGKKGRSYGGFYAASEADAEYADSYAKMQGESGQSYDLRIKPGTKILDVGSGITRLSQSNIDKWTDEGIGVVVGKDPRGKIEYAVIDKNAIESLSARGIATAAPKTAPADQKPVNKNDEPEQSVTGENSETARTDQETDPMRKAVQDAIAAGEVTHTTRKGKVLNGYVIKGMKPAEAKAVDPYTFPKEGGAFIRRARADELLSSGAEGASATPDAKVTRQKAIADINKAVTPENKDGIGTYLSGPITFQLDDLGLGDVEITVTNTSSQFKGRAKEIREKTQRFKYNDIKGDLSAEAVAAIEAFKAYDPDADPAAGAPDDETPSASTAPDPVLSQGLRVLEDYLIKPAGRTATFSGGEVVLGAYRIPQAEYDKVLDRLISEGKLTEDGKPITSGTPATVDYPNRQLNMRKARADAPVNGIGDNSDMSLGNIALANAREGDVLPGVGTVLKVTAKQIQITKPDGNVMRLSDGSEKLTGLARDMGALTASSANLRDEQLGSLMEMIERDPALVYRNGVPMLFDDPAEQANRGQRGGRQRIGQPLAPPVKQDVDQAAEEADPNPTDAQKEAGNYKKGHVVWNGMNLTIENAKGSERSGTDQDGETWSVTMPAHYGYFKMTEGADGEHVDFYMGEAPDADYVMWIDQADANTGKFDEHKIMVGFPSRGAALEAYRGAFNDGRGDDRIGGIFEGTVAQLKAWLESTLDTNFNSTKPVNGKLDFPFKKPADATKTEAKPTDKTDKTDKTAPKGEKLEDFGEEIGGARKHFYEAKKRLLEAMQEMDLDGMDLSSMGLNDLLPMPDFEKLASDGDISLDGLFIIAAIRAAIPTKPNSRSWQMSEWKNAVAKAHADTKAILGGDYDAIEILRDNAKYEQAFGRRSIADGIDLNAKLDENPEYWTDVLQPFFMRIEPQNMMEVASNFGIREQWVFASSANERTNTGKIEITAKGRVSKAPWRGSRVADTVQEAAELANDWAAMRKKAMAEARSDKGSFNYGFHIREARNGTASYIYARKPKLHSMMTFATSKEARAFLNSEEGKVELTAMANEMRQGFEERRRDNKDRVGPDWRKGKDVSAKSFLEAFGFRGGQFGNSVTLKERTSFLNATYDSLMDLAAILGVSPKSLSLNGELAIAFGARGKGGKGAAAAHYEPGQVVINLTRVNGAGSLAHEWFHALDHYLAKTDASDGSTPAQSSKPNAKNRRQDFMTARQRRYAGEGAMPRSVYDAFQTLRQMFGQSGYEGRMAKYDKFKAAPYWSDPIEMGARSFEAWVLTHLNERSLSHDFLVNTTKDSGGALPTIGERGVIFPMFGQIMDELKAVEGFAVQGDAPSFPALPDGSEVAPLKAGTTFEGPEGIYEITGLKDENGETQVTFRAPNNSRPITLDQKRFYALRAEKLFAMTPEGKALAAQEAVEAQLRADAAAMRAEARQSNTDLVAEYERDTKGSETNGYSPLNYGYYRGDEGNPATFMMDHIRNKGWTVWKEGRSTHFGLKGQTAYRNIGKPFADFGMWAQGIAEAEKMRAAVDEATQPETEGATDQQIESAFDAAFGEVFGPNADEQGDIDTDGIDAEAGDPLPDDAPTPADDAVEDGGMPEGENKERQDEPEPSFVQDGEAAPKAGARQSLSDAKANLQEGLKESMQALNTLFGPDMNRMNSGLVFDEETYKKALPHFKKAYRAYADAATNLVDAFAGMIRFMRDQGLNASAIGNMKPYFIRFMKDVETNAINPFADDAPEMSADVENMAAAFEKALDDGTKFKTINAARRMAAETIGRDLTPADYKTVEEAIELAVVRASRSIVKAGKDKAATFDALQSLYQAQPLLAQRTTDSVRRQAYSTPAPLAYLASELAGIDSNTTVYEPTAGNGMLLLGADPKLTTANELDADRAARLRNALGGDATITVGSALDVDGPSEVDVVIQNPPFGKLLVKDSDQATQFSVPYGVDGTTTEIDHAIVAKTLESMTNDGRAVLIVGGHQGDADTRKSKYRGKPRAFWNWLYDNYGVIEHFTVSGDLYKRQGAGWPVDVVVIEGRQASTKALPMAEAPTLYDAW